MRIENRKYGFELDCKPGDAIVDDKLVIRKEGHVSPIYEADWNSLVNWFRSAYINLESNRSEIFNSKEEMKFIARLLDKYWVGRFLSKNFAEVLDQ